MSLNSIKAGNIVVASNHIYNTGVAADTGSININMLGYNEGDSYYRDTKIGDGKNTVILEITGKSKASIFYGPVKISHADSSLLSLKNASLPKTDKSVIWGIPISLTKIYISKITLETWFSTMTYM